MQRAISVTCHQMCACLTATTRAAHCFSKVPYLRVTWVKVASEAVCSIFMSGSRSASYQLSSALWLRDVTRAPQPSDRQHWAGVHLISEDPWAAGGGDELWATEVGGSGRRGWVTGYAERKGGWMVKDEWEGRKYKKRNKRQVKK